MEFSETGDLVVTQPRQGRVVLLQRDNNSDGQHDGEQVLLDQLRRPHGLEFYQGWLYIAESHAVGRVRFNHTKGTLEGPYEHIITGLTDDGNHWSKSIRIGDDHLYVSMGSTCNVCEEDDPRRATIMRFNADGSNGTIYATGLRNSVGLDFAPWDGSLYATDNGRDLLGDDYPVCELNKIEEGQFYGWPYINAFGDLDPDFSQGHEHRLESARSPVFGFAAHNAPLGMRFVRNSQLPEHFHRSALVALHGSWNRSQPDGYRVVSLHWQEDGSITQQDFLSGFELDGHVIGRPVDIAEGRDGCFYISDDYAGSIYRACYGIEQNLDDSDQQPRIDPLWQGLDKQQRQQLVNAGRILYENQGCAACHRLQGRGAPSGKALEQLHQRYGLAELQEYFLTPNPPMPQYALPQAQRQQLAAYLLQATR
jgi:glucose/arabinose dehydrogenase/cytochrome c553